MGALTANVVFKTNGAVVVAEPLFRLSIGQYHEMIRHGILTDDDPVELLEGLLVNKMSKRRGHSYTTQTARDVLTAVLPAGWFAEDQEPVTISDEDSEPEPDISVIRGERRRFRRRHPTPKDVGLLVEVADTTLKRDRGFKKRIYARATIPIYWIINLPDRKVEVYTEPSGPAMEPDYAARKDYKIGADVPLILDGEEVARIRVKDLFA
jgi:Uma2 family endonuclease